MFDGIQREENLFLGLRTGKLDLITMLFESEQTYSV